MDLYFAISKPRARLALCATALTVTFKSECSCSTTPKYVYLSTMFKGLEPHINLKDERATEFGRKCIILLSYELTCISFVLY